MDTTEGEPKSCLANPYLGTASFDGLRFKTDRITDPRWDRVIPIFEEEQITTCRVIGRRRLIQDQEKEVGRTLRVLDVGTGSGVLGIWAAAHGCEVTAIDISARAIEFSRHNMNLGNNRKRIEASSGAIKFELCSVEHFAKRKGVTGRFDIVLMNPPFNPTAPGIRPAQHADAGPDGLCAFRRQLPLAWRLVKDGGLIVGCQMILHPAGQASQWWSHFAEQLIHGPFSLTYAPLLRKPEFSAGNFLKSQYRSFLKGGSSRQPNTKAIRDYIAETVDSRSCPAVFSFYYYEIRKLRQRHPLGKSSKVRRIKLKGLPNTSWSKRIAMHRIVVETASSSDGVSASEAGCSTLAKSQSPQWSR